MASANVSSESPEIAFSFADLCGVKKARMSSLVRSSMFEPNHALARDSFPYILSTADAVLFFCYNSRKPA